jgi:hypothetical protein
MVDAKDPLRDSAAGTNAEACGRVFLIIFATEHWTRSLALWESLETGSIVLLAAVSLFCFLAWLRTTRGLGFAALTVVQLLVLHRDFPQVGNHAYFELLFCLLFALLDPYVGDERRLLVRAVRWALCAVLFWSGVQKLVHGYYFHGELLAHALSIESFRPVLSLLLSASEMARLSAFTGAVGDGSYRVASLPFVAVSNLVYIAEIALAGLLVAQGTRVLAVAGALVFLVVVEAAARELFFGLLFANAVLLFLDSGIHARLVPVFALASLGLLLVRLGILPSFVFY